MVNFNSFETSFGEKLRQARMEKGYSQAELARKMDVSRSTIHAWENNRNYPNFQSLQKLRKLEVLPN